ncbi:MAG: response regulator transcription factor [Verrucomicrobia bacterium]|nr:response regulator transcription factor [Verrucomicrobiota bacterium]
MSADAVTACPIPPSAELPAPARLRVVIAKPMRLYAEALAVVCRELLAGAEVGIVLRGAELLNSLRNRPADLLVLGLAFPDLDGLDLLAPIAREKLAGRVLVDSPRRDEYSLLMLRSARFDGFIDASTETVEALTAAIRAVLAGQGYISPTLRPQLVDREPVGALGQRLTPAELHVLGVIGDGSDNDEAAARLGLSPKTVQTHRRNIMRKLRVSTSAKLVREAVRLGVVRITPGGVLARATAGGRTSPVTSLRT